MAKMTVKPEEGLEATVAALRDIQTPTLNDDIPEPALPMAMVAATLDQQRSMIDPATPAGQMAMTVDEALYKMSNHAALVLDSMHKSWDAAVPMLNHSQQTIAALTEALKAYSPKVPYSASVNVTTPSGYPMSIQVQETTEEAFLARVGALMGFLTSNGFQPGAPF